MRSAAPQRLLHQAQQFRFVEGLGQVLESAALDHRDRLLDGAESRDDNHRSFAAPRADGGQNLVPVTSGICTSVMTRSINSRSSSMYFSASRPSAAVSV